jgi:sRNA-binding regulator protein Hfq
MPKYLILFFLLITGAVYGQKTDSLYHVNGNIMTGEIKKLDHGILSFKMDGMGTISVKHESISTLKSNKLLEFTSDRGRTYFGKIDTCNQEGKIKIITAYDTVEMHMYQLVEIFPIRNNFFRRLSGKFDLGFNYTKASDVGRVNFDVNLSYRYKKYSWNLYSSNIQTYTPGDTVAPSSKHDAQITFQRKLNRRWLWTTFIATNQNTELGLQLRGQAGAGAIFNILHRSKARFYFQNALVPNFELGTESDKYETNLEFRTTLNYDFYKHTDPEMYITSYVDLYPSLSNWGRYRVNYNLDARVEIVNNFFIGLKYYYNFDSNPTSTIASQNDYGITTTLGYSFN